ncbi:MAG TPA: hypothetical protein VGD59_02690 [Acidisarcina sp.]
MRLAFSHRVCPILKFIPAIALALAAAAPAAAASHDVPPVTDASTFPDVEVHAQEKVSIAADPYDTKEKCKLLRVNYSQYEILPIRVIITNNGDKPISLDQARIHLIARDGSKIEAAEPEDVERRASSASNRGKTIPLPSPLPSIHTAPGGRNRDIEEDFSEFEFQALVVEAHTTRAGFLFYDVSGLRDPLKGAKLYLRRLRGADGRDLFYFEVPFDKYLAAQPK